MDDLEAEFERFWIQEPEPVDAAAQVADDSGS